MKRNFWIYLVLFMGMMCACKSEKAGDDGQVVYTVTNAEVTTVSLPQTYVANIQSQRNIEIRSQQDGVLQAVYVEEGERVKAGQPLFRIAVVGANEEVAKAHADVEQAHIELQNVSKLTVNKIVSRNAQRMAQAKYQSAVADYRLAQTRRRLSLIRAPFSGIIGRIPNKIGSLLHDGDLLTSLSDNDKMYAYFNVSEPEYLDYQMHPEKYRNLKLTLVLANGEDFPARGYIRNIDGEFDHTTGNISFRAEFPNIRQILRNGETGNIRIEKPMPHAMIIPQQAVYELQDKKYVFVVDAAGILHSREIQIAAEKRGIYILKGGLSATDRFLVDGIQKVKDDQKVKVRFKDAREVLKSFQLTAD